MSYFYANSVVGNISNIYTAEHVQKFRKLFLFNNFQIDFLVATGGFSPKDVTLDYVSIEYAPYKYNDSVRIKHYDVFSLCSFVDMNEEIYTFIMYDYNYLINLESSEEEFQKYTINELYNFCKNVLYEYCLDFNHNSTFRKPSDYETMNIFVDRGVCVNI